MLRSTRNVSRVIKQCRLQALLARQTVTLGQQNALEPTGKGVRLAELTEIAPGGKKSLLRDIFRQREIAQADVRVRISHILKSSHQFAEGAMLFVERGVRVDGLEN